MDEIKTGSHGAIVLSSDSEQAVAARLAALLRATPIPDDDILPNLGLFLTSKTLSRLLFFDHVYRSVVGTHGLVVEFGVRWGQTLALLTALRSIYEPFNRHRRIVGFDTFAGLRGVAAEDGTRSKCVDGAFSVPEGYAQTLGEVLTLHERLNPMAHLRRFELVAGDATETVPQWFNAHPEALVSLAIFDFDIYAPTKVALEAVAPRLFRGSVLVFDELSDDVFPGETIALRETLGVRDLRIQRLPTAARICYAVVE